MPHNTFRNKFENRSGSQSRNRFALILFSEIGILMLLLFFLFIPASLASQQNAENQDGQNGKAGNGAEDRELNQDLKRNFIGIELGQSLEEFRSEFRRQPEGNSSDTQYYFLYDLSTSEVEEGGRQETLIEIQGNGYIEKGVFQFAGLEGEPRLVTISIFLNPEWNSYDEFFAKLNGDYGNPSRLNPQRSVWENQQTIITLEKTLRYKIIDKEYVTSLQEREQKEFDLYQYSYEEFLKKF